MVNVVLFSVGNPGPVNRHSTGHYVLGQLVQAFEAPQMTKKATYSITRTDNLFFVRSNAYMNESATALRQLAAQELILPAVVVVVYDDFELEMPKVKLRQFKKNESHNGVKSCLKVIESLGVPAYKLGVGIGPKPKSASRDTMASWVLSKFKEDEKQQLEISMKYVFKYVNELLQSEGDVGDCNKLNARIQKQVTE